MWKYLGWPLAVAAIAGAYWVYQASASREAAVQAQLAESQQLVVQVSNRLAVVEAQFNTYKLTQERKEREEREARERQLRERDANYRAEPVVERAAPVSPEMNPEPETINRRDDGHNRRSGNGTGRSIGDGVNSLLDRLRNGFQ